MEGGSEEEEKGCAPKIPHHDQIKVFEISCFPLNIDRFVVAMYPEVMLHQMCQA